MAGKKSKLMVLSLVVLPALSAILLCYVYELVTAPPPLPKLDMDQWWGPYPIDLKQDSDHTLRPYTIEFTDIIVNDLKERLLHRRPFTLPLENTGFTYGFNTDYLTRVLDYWQNQYNFKDREQFLNNYDHYLTNIQGLEIHYLHAKPKLVENVTVIPLLMIHGWPGSFREFYEIIPKLIKHRPNQDFVFEVIVPSIPGFGYSQAPVRPGMGPNEVSVIFSKLMKRIGHENYYVQGGDYGHDIGSVMATLFPEEILGFHSNMPFVQYTNAHALSTALLGALWPSALVEPEQVDRMYPLNKYFKNFVEESGYYHIQATKPDTVGVGLSDSPAGLAAYILEKFSSWTNMDYKLAKDGGLLNKFSLTHLLDNVMIYWATNTITSSMRHYALKYQQLSYMDRIPTEVPTCGIKFKHELVFQPDSILKHKYTNYLHSTVVEAGGHFAAMEHPDILADDIYKAVELFRNFHARKGSETTKCFKKETKEAVTPAPPQTIYDFTVKDIMGRQVKLDRYKGHVLIIINVASECGYTDTHYTQLNQLYEKYAQSRGLRILAFPCNQFGGQEPGTPKEIMQFAKKRNVKFDMFEKVDVNGENTHPLWDFLKRAQSGTMGDFIKWNFSKFIVDKNGIPVERFGPNVNPVDLEPYLAKYW